jgi:hypothetical protein
VLLNSTIAKLGTGHISRSKASELFGASAIADHRDIRAERSVVRKNSFWQKFFRDPLGLAKGEVIRPRKIGMGIAHEEAAIAQFRSGQQEGTADAPPCSDDTSEPDPLTQTRLDEEARQAAIAALVRESNNQDRRTRRVQN